jgi:4-hydroxybenzoyl-CoA thioesterase/acyl-CoA thioester hydrolase
MTDAAPVTEFHTTRRVEFADTDLGGIVHFARFFVFMESAEHELMRSLGTSVHVTADDGRVIGWPRVAAKCEYLAPLRFGDLVEIVLRVARKGERSMTYEAEFFAGGRLCARGRMSSVCCVLDDPNGLRPIPIPEPLASRLAEGPAAAGAGRG